MAEIGELGEEPPRKGGLRRRIGRFFLPEEMQNLEALEDQLFRATVRLGRVLQQNRSLMKDVGLTTSRTWSNLWVGDYNPEEIGYDEYKKMLNYDSQVIAGFDLIQMGVLMKPWRIKHPNDEIVAMLTLALKRMKQPSIRDAMKEMLKAVAYGNSVTEIVFDDFRGKWVPREKNALKTFDPERIKFFSDLYGNLLKIEERIGGERIELPLNRTLVWSHEKEWGNWYGKSILRGCYKNWFIKDAMLKFANIAYERFGSPALLGIAANIRDMNQISEALTHLYARSQAVIIKREKEDPTDIRVIESKRTEMPFDRYIEYHDAMILRRMLIGHRIFEGGGGTYGPKVPFDIILMRFQDYRLELEGIMNELLQIITELNWEVDVYPEFEFQPLTTMDAEQLRKSIWEALDRKVVHREEPWIRQELHFPEAPTDFKPSEEDTEEPEAEETEEEP